jgi:hypothetical protein
MMNGQHPELTMISSEMIVENLNQSSRRFEIAVKCYRKRNKQFTASI